MDAYEILKQLAENGDIRAKEILNKPRERYTYQDEILQAFKQTQLNGVFEQLILSNLERFDLLQTKTIPKDTLFLLGTITIGEDIDSLILISIGENLVECLLKFELKTLIEKNNLALDMYPLCIWDAIAEQILKLNSISPYIVTLDKSIYSGDKDKYKELNISMYCNMLIKEKNQFIASNIVNICFEMIKSVPIILDDINKCIEEKTGL